MKETVFGKYFTMCGIIILSSIVFLGAVLLLFASQYFKHERYALLAVNVRTAAGVVKQEIAGTISQDETMAYFDMLASSVNATFFFADIKGEIIFGEKSANNVYFGLTVPNEALEAANSGQYKAQGNLGGIFGESNFIVGISVPDANNAEPIGYVFASSSSNSLTEFLTEIMKMFFFSSVAVLSLSFIVLYFATLRITTPLKEMALAAKQFGQGRFSTRLNVRGNDEIAQLALALNNMATDLSTLENMRRSFTANVSHELKTPTTTIAGFIDGILDGTIPPAQHKRYLRVVSEEVQRMSKLVGSMLNLSKIEAGELELNRSEFNIFDVVARVIINLRQAIENKQLTVQGLDHDKVNAYGDSDLIYQVVYNLVENAIKFSEQNGCIQFRFTESPNGSSVVVRNGGKGISNEDLPKVFDRFYKTDRSRGLDKYGAGLGLFIVRTIIDLHSGEVAVRSAHGEYTEFEFTLPK
ncbi:MAG: HAMP domain-containing histidine kinase [Oscillospiraceae bacterium]|nr:HAMP domain-containing histidine kinase [Oscillospiraceae bacterium]